MSAAAAAAAAADERFAALAAACAPFGIDPSAPPPADTLLAIISACYTTGDPTAQTLLNAFSASPYAWDVAHALLQGGDSALCAAAHSQHYGASLVEEKVRLVWTTAGEDEKDGVRRLLQHHLSLRCAAMHAVLV